MEISETLEPLEAILMALTEPMNSNKLFEESLRYRPKMSKTTYTETIKRAEAERIIIEKLSKREHRISKNYEIVRDLIYTKIKYKAILNQISEFITKLNEIEKMENKKKFLRDGKFFHKLIFQIEETMYYQKEILFNIQTFHYTSESQNDLYRKYAKSIDEMNIRRFNLLKKINKEYFHTIYVTLQDRLYQEWQIPQTIYEKDMIEYAKLIGYNEKTDKTLTVKKSKDVRKLENWLAMMRKL